MVSSDVYLIGGGAGGGLNGCYRHHVSKDPNFFNLTDFS